MFLIIILSLIGGLIMLDKYAIGEFGVSQPIIACPLIGLFFGAPEAGLTLGVLLQLIFFSNLPIGRSIPPDAQAGAVLSIASFILLRKNGGYENILTFSYLIGIVGGLLGTIPDIIVRRISNELYQQFLKNVHQYLKLHLLGLILVYLRGFLFLLIMLIFIRLFGFLTNYFSLDEKILLLISIAIGSANAIYLFYKKLYITYFLTGVLIGCLYQFLVK